MIDNFKQTEQTIETEEQQSQKIRQIQGILANPVVTVFSKDNHARYYVESYMGHHLIEIENSKLPTGDMLNTLTVTHYSLGRLSSPKTTQVKLTNKEIDDLLTILLQWRMRQEGEEAAD